MIRYLMLIAMLSTFTVASGQKAVSDEIKSLKSSGRVFQSKEVLIFQSQDLKNT